MSKHVSELMQGEALSSFMGTRKVKPVATCVQDTATSKQQPQQPDKVGTQITLLKTGCLEALVYLSTASSVIVRIQVLSYFVREYSKRLQMTCPEPLFLKETIFLVMHVLVASRSYCIVST